MIRMTLSEYLRVPKDYRGVWTNERWNIPNWVDIREKHLGKRTLMPNINGGTCLLVEGMGLEIIDDSDWKKPDAVRKEISRQCLKFFTARGIEPHYADCLIRYKALLLASSLSICFCNSSLPALSLPLNACARATCPSPCN